MECRQKEERTMQQAFICANNYTQGTLVYNKHTNFFFFFKSLLVACPTHTNPPGSGLGTGGIVFDKHIDKSTQQMNLKVHSYVFFTMRLAVKHSISSS